MRSTCPCRTMRWWGRGSSEQRAGRKCRLRGWGLRSLKHQRNRISSRWGKSSWCHRGWHRGRRLWEASRPFYRRWQSQEAELCGRPWNRDRGNLHWGGRQVSSKSGTVQWEWYRRAWNRRRSRTGSARGCWSRTRSWSMSRGWDQGHLSRDDR